MAFGRMMMLQDVGMQEWTTLASERLNCRIWNLQCQDTAQQSSQKALESSDSGRGLCKRSLQAPLVGKLVRLRVATYGGFYIKGLTAETGHIRYTFASSKTLAF